MTDPFLEEVEEREPPTDEELATVANLARKQLRLEDEVVQAQALLDAAKERLAQVAERELPKLMLDLGLEEFKLTGGGVVTIDDDWQASIPLGTKEKDKDKRLLMEEQRKRAFVWLTKNGHGDLIKRRMEVMFGRGEGKIADTLLAFIRKSWPDRKVTDREEVHAQTLSAFVREQVRLGKLETLPLDDLGARHVRKSKVVLPKAAP